MKTEATKTWENEPDSKEFEHNGYKCWIKRHGTQLHLCGYVGVPENHPWYGKDYNDTVQVSQATLERPVDMDKIGAINLLCGNVDTDKKEMDLVLALDVHGGITYAKGCRPGEDADGLWWFGFDCAHTGDTVPSMDAMFNDMDSTYKTMDYVTDECASLADQLNAVKEEKNEH